MPSTRPLAIYANLGTCYMTANNCLATKLTFEKPSFRGNETSSRSELIDTLLLERMTVILSRWKSENQRTASGFSSAVYRQRQSDGCSIGERRNRYARPMRPAATSFAAEFVRGLIWSCQQPPCKPLMGSATSQLRHFGSVSGQGDVRRASSRRVPDMSAKGDFAAASKVVHLGRPAST